MSISWKSRGLLINKQWYIVFAALIESDAEGIGGSGFIECIREHINQGWHCQLTEEQFLAVKELVYKYKLNIFLEDRSNLVMITNC